MLLLVCEICHGKGKLKVIEKNGEIKIIPFKDSKLYSETWESVIMVRCDCQVTDKDYLILENDSEL